MFRRLALVIVVLALLACKLTGSVASPTQPYGEAGRSQPSTGSGVPAGLPASPTPAATTWQARLSCPACARDGLPVDLWKDPLTQELACRLPNQATVTVMDARRAGGTLFYYVAAQGQSGWVAGSLVQIDLPGTPAGQTAVPVIPRLSVTPTNPHGAGTRPSPTVFTPAPSPTRTASPAPTRSPTARSTTVPAFTPRPPQPTSRPVAPSPTSRGGKG